MNGELNIYREEIGYEIENALRELGHGDLISELEGAFALKDRSFHRLLIGLTRLAEKEPSLASRLAADAKLLPGTVNVMYFPSIRVANGRKGGVYSKELT